MKKSVLQFQDRLFFIAYKKANKNLTAHNEQPDFCFRRKL